MNTLKSSESLGVNNPGGITDISNKIEETKIKDCMEWISVKDRLPELDNWVLVILPKIDGGFYYPFVTQYKGDGKFRDEHEDDNRSDFIPDYSKLISHWRPLPEPPKEL